MDSPHLIPDGHQIDAIRERHQRVATRSPTHPVVNVVARLLIWLALTLATFVAWLNALLVGFTLGQSSDPPPEPDRALVIAIPVLFVLSLVSLVGPGAPRGLKAFGVAWAALAGWAVIVATVDLL